MNKILITGAGGFLGSYLSSFSRLNEITSLQRTVRESDAYLLRLANNEKQIIENQNFQKIIENAILSTRCSIIINCIANTSAERCEIEPDKAFYANAEIPLLISQIANDYGVKVVQISTDAVFGQSGENFSTRDKPVPKSIYGRTKLSGEENVLKTNPQNLIVRTNFFGSYKPKTTLFNYFFNNLVEKNPVIGFTNQIFTPMYIEDLVLNLFNLAISQESGIFHMGGNFTISKYDLAIEIARCLNLPESLVIPKVYTNDPKGPTRNLNISLNSTGSEKYILSKSSLTQGVSKAIELG
jgi:dTDP-4-dehydrorhamnose reductase